MASGNGSREVLIAVRDGVVGFGDHIVLNQVDLGVYSDEILGFEPLALKASRMMAAALWKIVDSAVANGTR